MKIDSDTRKKIQAVFQNEDVNIKLIEARIADLKSKLATTTSEEKRTEIQEKIKKVEGQLTSLRESEEAPVVAEEKAEAPVVTETVTKDSPRLENTEEKKQLEGQERAEKKIQIENKIKDLMDDMPMESLAECKELYVYLLKQKDEYPDVGRFAVAQSEKIKEIEELQKGLSELKAVPEAENKTGETPTLKTEAPTMVKEKGIPPMAPSEADEEKIKKVKEKALETFGASEAKKENAEIKWLSPTEGKFDFNLDGKDNSIEIYQVSEELVHPSKVKKFFTFGMAKAKSVILENPYWITHINSIDNKKIKEKYERNYYGFYIKEEAVAFVNKMIQTVLEIQKGNEKNSTPEAKPKTEPTETPKIKPEIKMAKEAEIQAITAKIDAMLAENNKENEARKKINSVETAAPEKEISTNTTNPETGKDIKIPPWFKRFKKEEEKFINDTWPGKENKDFRKNQFEKLENDPIGYLEDWIASLAPIEDGVDKNSRLYKLRGIKNDLLKEVMTQLEKK